MCGRFTLTRSAAEVAEHFGLDAVPELTPRFNIAPTQAAPAIRVRGAEGGRLLELRYWGLVPRWAKDARGAARAINARSETAAEKATFRDALRSRRCLVPMDGYYEWKTEGRRKQPHHIAREQGDLFAAAGLYEHWRGPGGEEIASVSILTEPAHRSLRFLHERMPVVVAAESYGRWLAPDESDGAGLLAVIARPGDGALVARPVSERVNKVANDDARCLGPAEDVQLSWLEAFDA